MKPPLGADPQSLAVEPQVDRIRSNLPGMQLTPDLEEPVVVGSATQCTGSMASRQGSRVVEKEQFGEATWLKQRSTLPAAKLELARDPAADVVVASNAPAAVVETTAISVEEPALGHRNKLTEWRHSVLPRAQLVSPISKRSRRRIAYHVEPTPTIAIITSAVMGASFASNSLEGKSTTQSATPSV